MDANFVRSFCTRIGCFLLVIVGGGFGDTADAANYRTRNFLVDAPSPQLAKAVGDAAERYRDELATYWTGRPLRPWPNPCPIRVVAGNLPAQGVTQYNPAPVRDFTMEVIGTPERILDSVLPHEVTHTVLATHFGRPLPRWADEGICTTVEHPSEKAKHEAKLREFLSTRRGIAMNKMFQLTEYPSDVLPMYAQGYSVCRFLIEQKDPETFIQFLGDYMQRGSWTANIKKHYGYDSLQELQDYWLAWVEAGSGPVAQFVKATPRQGSNNEIALASAQAEMPNGFQNIGGTDSASWYQRGGPPLPNPAQPGMNTQTIPPGPAARIASLDRSHSSINGSDNLANNNAANNNMASTNMAREAVPRWMPPSVKSSGRYSAATPQGEHSGSIRGDYPAERRSSSLRDNPWR